MSDWSWVDWPATRAFVASLPWAVGIILAALPPTRHHVVNLLADRNWHGTIAVVALVSASQIMISVADESDDGWFGQEAAAWMQAFGSIAALAIAIWIDQRSAERIKSDRLAEWQRQRDDRTQEGVARRQARLEAIRECRRALDLAAHNVRLMQFEGKGSIDLPVEFAERLGAANAAIDYYMAQSVDLELRTLAALTRAQQRMAGVYADLGRRWSVSVWQTTQPTIMVILGKAAEELESFLDLEDQDIIDLV